MMSSSNNPSAITGFNKEISDSNYQDSLDLVLAEMTENENLPSSENFIAGSWPNPANEWVNLIAEGMENLNLLVSGPGDGEIQGELVDIAGQLIKKVSLNLKKQSELKLTDLSNGIYYIRFKELKTGLIKTEKFIKQ